MTCQQWVFCRKWPFHSGRALLLFLPILLRTFAEACKGPCLNLTHWGRDKMDAISQTLFANEFSRMKMYEYRLKFHWSLFLRANYIPALVQIMAWRRPGDKRLSGQMMVRLPTHICVTRPQWVNCFGNQSHNRLCGVILVVPLLFPCYGCLDTRKYHYSHACTIPKSYMYCTSCADNTRELTSSKTIYTHFRFVGSLWHSDAIWLH